MWNLVSIESGKPGLVNDYLKKGYEPFAISTNSYGFAVVWMKKDTLELITVDGIPCIREGELKVEICNQQPKPIKRRSRKTAGMPKG